jgi:2-keto-3-deoxy-L-rhamnonate aldolase RhmA
MTTLKEKLRRKQPTIGSWLSLCDPHVCEMMAKQGGFDWLVVDMEHTATDMSGMAHMIQIIDLCGLDALVRVGANDPLLIKRALDAGATGVIIPQVNSREDALAAVSSAHYPPAGTRGAGLFRAHGYGADSQAYYASVADRTTVIVQIEHHEGVRNVEDIMAVDGVDGFLIGPYDLSASLGQSGNFDHPDVVACLDRLAAYAGTGDKAAGVHVVQPDAALLKRRVGEGFVFVAYGTDVLFLGERLAVAKREVAALAGT